MSIVRAASSATGPLRATASVVHGGRQLATAEGRIVGADDRLYAHGTKSQRAEAPALSKKKRTIRAEP